MNEDQVETLDHLPLYVKSAVNFMKREGVQAFKYKDLEVAFHPTAFIPKDIKIEPSLSDEERLAKLKKEEEELLFYSAQ